MVIFLASCATDNSQNSQTLTNEQNPETNISTTSEARKIVETMAEHMRKNSSDIQETNYKFFDIFETHSDEFYRKGVNLHAYSVHSDLIDYETLEKMNAENFLDGWVRHYGPDGIVGYSMKYSYENIICAADAVLKNVDERFQEIFYDDENNLNSEEEEKIFASRRYEYTFSCADKPDTLVGLTDVHFDAFGGGNNGTWRAYFEGDSVSLSFSELEEKELFSINAAEKTHNRYKIQASQNIFTEGETRTIIFDIQKNSCTIAKNGEEFPFSVNFEFEGKNYTGCASETNPFFMMGRFGKISSFLTKTGIEYHGSVPTDGKYEMYTSDDLVQIHFEHPANPEKKHYIILRNNSYNDTIYWNGDNKIDHETCEKFTDDKDLMAFGIFYNCKRVYQN